VKEKLNLFKKVLDDTCEHYIVSEDEDARTGHKLKDSFWGRYKAYIGMTKKRINNGNCYKFQ
jgi:transposase IS4 family protein